MSNVLSIPNSCRGREQHQSARDVGELRRDEEDISYSFCDTKKNSSKRNWIRCQSSSVRFRNNFVVALKLKIAKVYREFPEDRQSPTLLTIRRQFYLEKSEISIVNSPLSKGVYAAALIRKDYILL